MSSTPIHAFSLADICRAKTIPIEIRDDQGNVEGIVYLKEPGSVEGLKLQEKLNSDMPWYETVLNILALVLSDADGNPLIKSAADREKLNSIPPRMMMVLRDPCLEMLGMSFQTKEESKKEIATDGEDIDQTLAKLDDQVAATYRAGELELSSVVNAAGSVDEGCGVAIPIPGNENLHLDQDPGTVDTSTDPANPFVETAGEPK